MVGRRIQRGVVSFFSFLSALFFGAVVGLTAAIVAAYMLVDCAGLLAFIDAPVGRSIGEATATVGWSSLAVFSLLAGLTLGAEVYLGVAQSDLPRHGPTPAWLRALWAAAAGALVGALPCAVGVDCLLLGPAQAVPSALDSTAAFGTAAHLVSLGALTGAMTGLTMERFRIWRRPCRDGRALSLELARPAPREADPSQVRADPQPILPVDQ